MRQPKQNNADTRDYVNRDVPEMEEANDVSETQDDHENHQNADLNVLYKLTSISRKICLIENSLLFHTVVLTFSYSLYLLLPFQAIECYCTNFFP